MILYYGELLGMFGHGSVSPHFTYAENSCVVSQHDVFFFLCDKMDSETQQISTDDCKSFVKFVPFQI